MRDGATVLKMRSDLLLAIYINGVAQELLRMVRATADLPPDACVPAR
jgi:hypothetical protein